MRDECHIFRSDIGKLGEEMVQLSCQGKCRKIMTSGTENPVSYLFLKQPDGDGEREREIHLDPFKNLYIYIS